MPGFGQRSSRHCGDVADIGNAHFAVSRKAIEFALRRNRGAKIKKALHEQIRPQECERDAGPANMTLNRAVITLEAAFGAFVGAQLRQFHDMPHVTSLGGINEATLQFFYLNRRRNQEENAVHAEQTARNALWLAEIAFCDIQSGKRDRSRVCWFGNKSP